jgi:quinoprotein glucose dehydrogenase
MNWITRTAVVVSAVLAAWAAPVRAQDAEGKPRSVLDGVYSKDQAAKGRTTFQTICAECHTSGQFRGEAFQRTWQGRSVHDLFELLRTTMPQDNPGGLARTEYTAVIAYILELNGFPAGPSQLPADATALRQIRVEIKTASGN